MDGDVAEDLREVAPRGPAEGDQGLLDCRLAQDAADVGMAGERPPIQIRGGRLAEQTSALCHPIRLLGAVALTTLAQSRVRANCTNVRSDPLDRARRPSHQAPGARQAAIAPDERALSRSPKDGRDRRAAFPLPGRPSAPTGRYGAFAPRSEPIGRPRRLRAGLRTAEIGDRAPRDAQPGSVSGRPPRRLGGSFKRMSLPYREPIDDVTKQAPPPSIRCGTRRAPILASKAARCQG
jgi:hypothetical protein